MSITIESTPKADGFRMPGEFEPQEQVWTGWPIRGDVWPGFARPAQKTMAKVIEAIAEFEPVTVLCCESHYDFCRKELPQSENIRVVEMSYNDAWLRDCGATFVTDGQRVRGVDWGFNAWGGLVDGFYFPWDLDDKVARKMLEIERVDRYKAPFILEGGSIHCDGEGTVMTTVECLLQHNSNPELDQAAYTELLCDYLGAEKVLWLPKGIAYDSVWGHVDNMACFVRPGVVVMDWCDDPDDEQYEVSREVYDYLSEQTDARGRKLEIHKIHQPDPLHVTQEEIDAWVYTDATTSYEAGDRIAATYVNFLIVNGGIICPSFDDEVHDAAAKAKLEELFPGRRVVQIPCRQLVLGGGCIHCMTQQQPAV